MGRDQASQSQEAHRVYDQHVKPVEEAHEGEYALVTPDGQVMFAPTLVDIMKLGQERASRDNFIFKVGDVALGKVR